MLLWNTAYYKRFFPFYAFNILAGIDQNGNGALYAYDAIGSYDKLMYAAVGSAGNLSVPVLDSYFDGHNNSNPKNPNKIEPAKIALIDSMISAN